MTSLFVGDLPYGALFYPCSGQDFSEPLTEFAGYVAEVWFVDIRYSPETQALGVPERFRIEATCIWKPASVPREPWPAGKQARYPWVEPVVVTRRLHDRTTGATVTAYWRRGYGAAALHQMTMPHSVFLYRGDSAGDGGSGTLWLMGRQSAARPLIREVLARMPRGGLVVTDGSNCPRRRNPYAKLQQFHNSDVDSSEAVARSTPFRDPDGRWFECIDSVAPRYGPALVWRVS